MATILSLLRKVEALDINEVSRLSIDETKDAIADLNVEQLSKGLRSDGEEIAPSYHNPEYAEYKHNLNPLPGFGVPDLHLTGGFYQGLRVEVSGDSVKTFSLDEKNDALYKKYSSRNSSIFSLSPAYRREYVKEFLQKAFRQKVKEKTGL